MFIDPKLSNCFLWLPGEDQPDRAIIIMPLPDFLKPESIKFELRQENEGIYIGVEGQPPFIAGTLFQKAKDILHEVKEGLLYITIMKAEPTEWSIIIKAPLNEEHGIIDPQSAFTLSQHFFSVIDMVSSQEEAGQKVDLEQFKEMAQLAHGYLKVAVACRFSPALVYAASVTLNSTTENKEKDAAILLSLAADEYNNPQAHFLLGLLLVQKDETVLSAIPHFEAAYKAGMLDALNALGEIYSPEQVPRNSQENAQKAAECFETVIQQMPDHAFALMNMAKLLAKGLGVKKDIEKAKAYQKRALELNPELESFPIEESPKKWIAAGAATAVAAAAGVAAYNLLKKK